MGLQNAQTIVCVAGATGWVGRRLVPAIHGASHLRVGSATSRSGSGKKLGELLDIDGLTSPTYSNVVDALDAVPADVLVDYTSAACVKDNVLAALTRKVACVIGSSGLTDDDYEQIDALARQQGLGVLAAGNFAISATLLQQFASIAAQYLDSWEVIDYAASSKPDAPSGMTRELRTALPRCGVKRHTRHRPPSAFQKPSAPSCTELGSTRFAFQGS